MDRVAEGPKWEELVDAEAWIELVTRGEQLHGSAVTLSGEAARDLAETVAPVARELAQAGKALLGNRKAQEQGTQLYRLVPRKELAEGLQNGALRMGVPRKGGDATALVKTVTTGRTAGHADLVKAEGVRAKPSAMRALGPVAWQAMAMATQQHYLVEINDKLAGVAKGVDEVLARRATRSGPMSRSFLRKPGVFEPSLPKGGLLTQTSLRAISTAPAASSESSLALPSGRPITTWRGNSRSRRWRTRCTSRC